MMLCIGLQPCSRSYKYHIMNIKPIIHSFSYNLPEKFYIVSTRTPLYMFQARFVVAKQFLNLGSPQQHHCLLVRLARA